MINIVRSACCACECERTQQEASGKKVKVGRWLGKMVAAEDMHGTRCRWGGDALPSSHWPEIDYLDQ